MGNWGAQRRSLCVNAFGAEKSTFICSVPRLSAALKGGCRGANYTIGRRARRRPSDGAACSHAATMRPWQEEATDYADYAERHPQMSTDWAKNTQKPTLIFASWRSWPHLGLILAAWHDRRYHPPIETDLHRLGEKHRRHRKPTENTETFLGALGANLSAPLLPLRLCAHPWRPWRPKNPCYPWFIPLWLNSYPMQFFATALPTFCPSAIMRSACGRVAQLVRAHHSH